MLKIGDTVKIIAATDTVEDESYINSVGTIGTVTDIDEGEWMTPSGEPCYQIDGMWWYEESELVKGHMEFVEDHE